MTHLQGQLLWKARKWVVPQFQEISTPSSRQLEYPSLLSPLKLPSREPESPHTLSLSKMTQCPGAASRLLGWLTLCLWSVLLPK